MYKQKSYLICGQLAFSVADLDLRPRPTESRWWYYAAPEFKWSIGSVRAQFDTEPIPRKWAIAYESLADESLTSMV